MLTKEHLPGFIYLADQMLTIDFVSEEAEKGNIYELIADEGSGEYGEPTSPRTIRRAFNLRTNLAKGKIEINDYNRPELKTLNTLTYFHYDKKAPTRFRLFEKRYKEEIEKHYKANKPSDEIIDLIFGSNPKKINALEEKENDLQELLAMIKANNLENFKNELLETNARFADFRKKVNDDLKLQNDIIAHLKIELEQVQKKRKKASFIFRIFGSLGLFFVLTDQSGINLANLLDDFMDYYDVLDEDEILEDDDDD